MSIEEVFLRRYGLTLDEYYKYKSLLLQTKELQNSMYPISNAHFHLDTLVMEKEEDKVYFEGAYIYGNNVEEEVRFMIGFIEDKGLDYIIHNHITRCLDQPQEFDVMDVFEYQKNPYKIKTMYKER